ncbi:MAG TPA: GNAT family N-acetyltransferase [Candidatus Limnocylindria bacterium]|nr:GNAT family N-acetyltransferase [Candidatus Limnocylindria bacterium]
MDAVDERAVYPKHREAHVVLRDGTLVLIRPVLPDDEQAIARLFASLSSDSRRNRFFSVATDLGEEAHRAADVDQRTRYALVAVANDGRVVAHAAYFADGTGRAEVAWVVADDQRGRGLGTLLLAHLAERAEELGLGPFVAYVLPENRDMVEVLRESGMPMRTVRAHGQLVFEFPTSLSPAARDRFDRREQVATAASIGALLAPRSIAVIGASRSRGTIGGEVFHNLLATGFAGPVYPVNARAAVVQSVPAYPTIAAVPGPVDLAVIVVPAADVLGAARACADKGVRGLVVISAGFGETGEDGLARQRELVELCRASGMRLVGPNCMGVLNTAPDVRMNATFAPTFPPAGRVGFLSQSGALGLAIIDQCAERGIGLSTFVSVGNKADLSGNDLLQYWETDPATDVVLLYLESFGNPRKFARIARRIGRTKPILAVKSGRSVAGVRATSSHTGAVVASSDLTVDALFAQTGVVRTETLAELLDAAALFATQPLPAGRRVAVVTNAGGPAILCADALEAKGLEVPALPEALRATLRALLPPEASVANPVNMIASASGEQYAAVVRALAASDAVDAIIAIFIPPLVTRLGEVARALADASAALPRRIPLLAVLMSEDRAGAVMAAAGIPVFPYPEDAARALAHAADHAAWRALPEEAPPEYADVRRRDAADVIAAALEAGRGWLEPEEVALLLRAYGLPLACFLTARTPAEAGDAAATLGGSVALKALASGLVHKTEAGAVRVGLRGRAAVEAAAREMRDAVERGGHKVERFLVQAMAAPGTEMLVGMVHDRTFGPVIACGAGGTLVELLKDVNVRVSPLSARDAREMIRSLKTFPLLDGYRGQPKARVGDLENVVLRLSALVEACPEIAELDLNPVIVGPNGATIVDARIRVAAADPPPPLGALRR